MWPGQDTSLTTNVTTPVVAGPVEGGEGMRGTRSRPGLTRAVIFVDERRTPEEEEEEEKGDRRERSRGPQSRGMRER